MKTLSLSRGAQLDIEKCVANIGNRYDMVIVAAARAREIRRNNKSSNRRDHVFTVVTALEEIQAGKVGKNYFAEKVEVQKALDIK